MVKRKCAPKSRHGLSTSNGVQKRMCTRQQASQGEDHQKIIQNVPNVLPSVSVQIERCANNAQLPVSNNASASATNDNVLEAVGLVHVNSSEANATATTSSSSCSDGTGQPTQEFLDIPAKSLDAAQIVQFSRAKFVIVPIDPTNEAEGTQTNKDEPVLHPTANVPNVSAEAETCHASNVASDADRNNIHAKRNKRLLETVTRLEQRLEDLNRLRRKDAQMLQEQYRYAMNMKKSIREMNRKLNHFINARENYCVDNNSMLFGETEVRYDVVAELTSRHKHAPTTFFPRLCEYVLGRATVMEETLMSEKIDSYCRQDMFDYVRKFVTGVTEGSLKNAYGNFKGKTLEKEIELGEDYIEELIATVDMRNMAESSDLEEN